MYTVVANHNEFHPLESEQYLTITVGCAPEFATSASFLSARKESTKRDVAGIEPILFGALRRQTLTDNLSRFVPLVRIPHTAHVYVLNDTGDDLEVVIHWPGTFVWFHWYTTA